MAIYYPEGLVPDFSAATTPQYLAERVDSQGRLIVTFEGGVGGSGGLSEAQAEDLAEVATSTAAMAAALADTTASATAAEVLKRAVAGASVDVKFVAINTAASGNATLIAAVTGKKIVVLAFNLIAAGTTNFKFTDGSGGSNLTGAYPLTAQSGLAPSCENGLFATTAGTALGINNSAAIQVSGSLTYVEV